MYSLYTYLYSAPFQTKRQEETASAGHNSTNSNDYTSIGVYNTQQRNERSRKEVNREGEEKRGEERVEEGEERGGEKDSLTACSPSAPSSPCA